MSGPGTSADVADVAGAVDASVGAVGVESIVSAIFSRLEQRRLDNGLTVCLLPNRQAPLVSTSLWYRAGARHETGGAWGVAHFLEHMMFKGGRRFGPGDIDRLTQAAGGVNNAFTGHDGTSYFFSFSSDRWTEALDFEADRMAGLTLDEDQIEAERRVILEEISMYEDDPWDSLEIELTRRFYGEHPYGRPILGTRESLARLSRAELESFHRRHYRPRDAVLVIAGDIDAGAFDEAERRLGALSNPPAPRGAVAGDGKALEVSAAGERSAPQGLERVERRRGEMARLLLALAAPPADHPHYPSLCLAVSLLGRGRASRLHRALVDEGRLCASVSADTTEMVEAGITVLAAEPVPGCDLTEIEERLLQEIDALAEPAPLAELDKGRRLLLSDWVFGLERIEQQAVLAGSAVALFDRDYPARFLEGLLAATPESVAAAASEYLAPERGGVLAWSLPADDKEKSE